jgi:hypothetical protein
MPRLRLDPTSPSGVSIAPEIQATRVINRQTGAFVTNNIRGLLTAGTNVTVTGSGTEADPYRISVSGGGGGGGASTLDDLTDVDTTTYPASDGNTLTYTGGVWYPTDISAEFLSINGGTLMGDLTMNGTQTIIGRHIKGVDDLGAGAPFIIEGGYSNTDGLAASPIIVSGGQAITGDADGGDLFLTGGFSAGSGANGRVNVQDVSTGNNAVLDTSFLTTNRTLSFPDEDDYLATQGYVDAVSTSISNTGMGRVDHGSTAGTARPSGFYSIQWIGSVEPTNATAVDTWIDTS